MLWSARLPLCCPRTRKRDQPGNLREKMRNHPKYGREFSKDYTRYLAEPGMTVCFGDNTAALPVPTLVKSRRVGDKNGILLPLNRKRHWSITPKHVAAQDVPWEKKQMSVVWRGSTTGKSRTEDYDRHPRTQLVRRWFGQGDQGIDVGYSQVVQGKVQDQRYVLGTLSIKEQLRNALIVSVEGNDVASNLKWVLASNSVPVMPPPRYESWLLESQLQPWVHYVPVRPDFTDLGDALEWCRANPDACERMAKQGREYVTPFYRDQMKQAYAVVDRYLQKNQQVGKRRVR